MVKERYRKKQRNFGERARKVKGRRQRKNHEEREREKRMENENGGLV
jgi:hypothetical protein